MADQIDFNVMEDELRYECKNMTEKDLYKESFHFGSLYLIKHKMEGRDDRIFAFHDTIDVSYRYELDFIDGRWEVVHSTFSILEIDEDEDEYED